MDRVDELTPHTNPEIPGDSLEVAFNELTTHTNSLTPDTLNISSKFKTSSKLLKNSDCEVRKSNCAKSAVSYKGMCVLVKLRDGKPRLDCVPITCNVVSSNFEVPRLFRKSVQMDDGPEWHLACEKEMTSLKNKGVWTLVERPFDRQLIKGMWLFKRKPLLGGGFKHKARYVAMGNTQVEGFYYTETFAPTGKPAAL